MTTSEPSSNAPDLELALALYDCAYEYSNKHFPSELEWQTHCSFESFSESDLLREAAWVILCSGFRESVVRNLFDYISLCFCDWESAELISGSLEECVSTASALFSNGRKLRAIANIATRIEEQSFLSVKRSILLNPITELQTLPYIGPITSFHLAKNLGLDVAKADRHLVRLCARLRFGSCSDLCQAVAHVRGESIKVVDLVFWRSLAEQVI